MNVSNTRLGPVLLTYSLLVGCGGSAADPTPLPAPTSDPAPIEPSSASIRGRLSEIGSGAPLGGAFVCAGTPYLNHCGKTDANGRYEFAPIRGFDSAEIVFLADGYPDAWTQVPLIDGGSEFDARLPSAGAWGTLLTSAGSQAANAALVLPRPDGASIRVTDLALTTDPAKAPIEELGDLPIRCADPRGDPGTESADGFCVAFDPEPGFVRVSSPEESSCRFPTTGGSLVASRTFQSDAGLLLLVPMVCGDGSGAR